MAFLNAVRVLIPLKSGLVWNTAASGQQPDEDGLNPFEIRAGLEPKTGGKKPTGEGLNPFEIRAGLEPSNNGGIPWTIKS